METIEKKSAAPADVRDDDLAEALKLFLSLSEEEKEKTLAFMRGMEK
jgi:hypothetical protein